MLVNQDKTYKAINWALIFLALGFLSSPTLVSLFHIIILIPIFICFKRLNIERSISASSWVLILIFVWGLISTLVNYPDLVKPTKAFQELKFYLFGVGVTFPLMYYFDRTTTFQIRRLLKIVSFVIVIAFIVGCTRSYLKFDLVKWVYKETFHIRTGGFSHYMRYGYASAFLFILGLNIYFNRDSLKNLLSSKLIYVGIGISLLAVGTSQTRGGLLAILVSMPFLLLRYKPKLAKITFGAGLAFFVLILFATATKTFESRYLNVFQGSNQTRLSQFQSALYAMKENPVLGLGSNQFSFNVTELKERYDLHAKDYTGHAHNIVLEHGASFGVLGAVLIVLFFAVWFFEMLSIGDAFGHAIATYIIAFFVAGQVENLFDNTNAHLMFFLYSLSQAYKNTRFRSLSF
jgi:O-antigen ligase